MSDPGYRVVNLSEEMEWLATEGYRLAREAREIAERQSKYAHDLREYRRRRKAVARATLELARDDSG